MPIRPILPPAKAPPKRRPLERLEWATEHRPRWTLTLDPAEPTPS